MHQVGNFDEGIAFRGSGSCPQDRDALLTDHVGQIYFIHECVFHLALAAMVEACASGSSIHHLCVRGDQVDHFLERLGWYIDESVLLAELERRQQKAFHCIGDLQGVNLALGQVAEIILHSCFPFSVQGQCRVSE